MDGGRGVGEGFVGVGLERGLGWDGMDMERDGKADLWWIGQESCLTLMD